MEGLNFWWLSFSWRHKRWSCPLRPSDIVGCLRRFEIGIVENVCISTEGCKHKGPSWGWYPWISSETFFSCFFPSCSAKQPEYRQGKVRGIYLPRVQILLGECIMWRQWVSAVGVDVQWMWSRLVGKEGAVASFCCCWGESGGVPQSIGFLKELGLEIVIRIGCLHFIFQMYTNWVTEAVQWLPWK